MCLKKLYGGVCERWGNVWVKKGFMKGTNELHYGERIFQRFLEVDIFSSKVKSAYLGLCCFDLVDLFQISLWKDLHMYGSEIQNLWITPFEYIYFYVLLLRFCEQATLRFPGQVYNYCIYLLINNISWYFLYLFDFAVSNLIPTR